MLQKIISSIHCLVSPWLLYLTLCKFAFLYSHLSNASTSLLCLSDTQLIVHHITIAKAFFENFKSFPFLEQLTHTKVHQSMTLFVNPFGTYCFFFSVIVRFSSPHAGRFVLTSAPWVPISWCFFELYLLYFCTPVTALAGLGCRHTSGAWKRGSRPRLRTSWSTR